MPRRDNQKNCSGRTETARSVSVTAVTEPANHVDVVKSMEVFLRSAITPCNAAQNESVFTQAYQRYCDSSPLRAITVSVVESLAHRTSVRGLRRGLARSLCCHPSKTLTVLRLSQEGAAQSDS
jgi:hypothetical protein